MLTQCRLDHLWEIILGVFLIISGDTFFLWSTLAFWLLKSHSCTFLFIGVGRLLDRVFPIFQTFRLILVWCLRTAKLIHHKTTPNLFFQKFDMADMGWAHLLIWFFIFENDPPLLLSWWLVSFVLSFAGWICRNWRFWSGGLTLYCLIVVRSSLYASRYSFRATRSYKLGVLIVLFASGCRVGPRRSDVCSTLSQVLNWLQCILHHFAAKDCYRILKLGWNWTLFQGLIVFMVITTGGATIQDLCCCVLWLLLAMPTCGFSYSFLWSQLHWCQCRCS